MGRSLRHLSHRFFEVLGARRLDDAETALAREWLGSDLWPLFDSQQISDQRHGFNAGKKLAGTARRDLVVAAMLHDVGKVDSSLGVIGRTIATVLMALGVLMTARMRRYRDHGLLGAMKLEAAGAPSIAVLFARHHQGERPESIQKDDWDTLIWADEPGMPREGANP
jgi:hypothetical protein